MWCSTCQRDVPALGSPSGGCIRCTKCGSDLPAGQSEGATGEPKPVETALPSEMLTRAKLGAALRTSPLGDNDWQLEAELRGVRRLITSLKSREPAPAAARPVPTPHLTNARKLTRSDAIPPDASDDSSPVPAAFAPPRSHSAGWLVLSLGLAVFSCGAVLLVWSLLGQRNDLWSIGMPLTLIGQAGLILGLVLHLDGLWNTSRNTAAVLHQLDGELKHVRQATTLLSSTHSAAGQSFYLHLAEGATPQLLLADLKGQMDLLSQQMARQHN